MFVKLATSVVSKYNGLTITGSPRLYADVIPDEAAYPACTYSFPASVNFFDFCSDFYDFLLQISVWDNATSPLGMLGIMDAVHTGFNNAILSGLDGTLVRLDPAEQNWGKDQNSKGWQGILQYRIMIHKAR
jgi:hypothetical protein